MEMIKEIWIPRKLCQLSSCLSPQAKQPLQRQEQCNLVHSTLLSFPEDGGSFLPFPHSLFSHSTDSHWMSTLQSKGLGIGVVYVFISIHLIILYLEEFCYILEGTKKKWPSPELGLTSVNNSYRARQTLAVTIISKHFYLCTLALSFSVPDGI